MPYHKNRIMDTTVNMSDIELAYLAGIVDGEGSIGLYYSRTHNVPKVSLAVINTDFRLRDWVMSMIPWAKIHERDRENSLGKRRCWTWTVKNREQVNTILSAICPYMVVKADQAKLVLSLLNDEKDELGDRQYNKYPSSKLLARQRQTEIQLKALKRSQVSLVQ